MKSVSFSSGKDDVSGRPKSALLLCVILLFSAVVFHQHLVDLAFDEKNPVTEAPMSIDGDIVRQDILDGVESLSGFFIENRGQIADGGRYYTQGNPSVSFRDEGVMFVLSEMREQERSGNLFDMSIPAFMEQTTVRSLAYFLRFQGANTVVPVGREDFSFRSNFFISNDSRQWVTNVLNYGEVWYQNLYDGIDLVYRIGEEGLKYEFLVHPGADPGRIIITYEGIDGLDLDSAGNVVVHTSLGDLLDSAPFAYQKPGQEVKCTHMLPSSLSHAFDCSEWDASKLLLIDPLVYATFLGGGEHESGISIAIDSAGNSYVTGYTASTDFPTTPGAFDNAYYDLLDAFVAKLNATGSSLMYATFLGGSQSDRGNSLAVDPDGNAYLAGYTRSTDFPTTAGAFNPLYNSGVTDIFVAKLNDTGSDLLYSTFLGGDGADEAFSIAVDSAGNAYLTGRTDSTDFPTTPGAFATSYNGGTHDIFVAKLSAMGSDLSYATFLGGSQADSGESIAVDSSGNTYVTGRTDSVDFPTSPGAFDSVLNGTDAFVAKLNATGSAFVYATFLGGKKLDYGSSITVDSAGNAYLAGSTGSSDFPTTLGAFDSVLKGTDAFVAKLNASGSTLTYATFLGGSIDDFGFSLSVDSAGSAYVTGQTASTDFPTTPGAFDTSCNGNVDIFVAKLNAMGSGLSYATFLGGTQWDYGYSIAVDSVDSAYVTGKTGSMDFPTTLGGFDTSYNGKGDVLVAKLDMLALPDLAVTSSDLHTVPLEPLVNGTAVDLYVNVSNIGGLEAMDFSVLTFDDRDSDMYADPGEVIGTKNVDSLPADDSAQLMFVWAPNLTGTHLICAWVDPPPGSVNESNEDNNLACIEVQVLSPVPPSAPTILNAYLGGEGYGDVVLVWSLSSDEGNESNRVVGYQVFRGDVYSTEKTGYSLLDFVPNGTSYYADFWAGEGDPGNHFYNVCAVNAYNISSCSYNQAGKFTRPLSQGPNLVSIPLIQSDESIKYVLQTIKYDKAWYYDSFSQEWKWFMTFKNYRRELWNINHTMGLWVNVTQDSNLTVAGIVPASTSIHLAKGWNLVGFPSFDSTYSVSYLNVEVVSTRVEGFDSPPPYCLRVLGDMEVLQAGYGYWVRVEGDIVWVVYVQ